MLCQLGGGTGRTNVVELYPSCDQTNGRAVSLPCCGKGHLGRLSLVAMLLPSSTSVQKAVPDGRFHCGMGATGWQALVLALVQAIFGLLKQRKMQ